MRRWRPTGRGRRRLLALVVSWLLVSLAPGSGSAGLEGLSRRIPPFRLSGVEAPSPQVAEYYAHYGLDLRGVEHHFGTVEAGGHRIATHLFVPEHPRDTVVMLHGYLDHVGLLGPLLRSLVEDGHAVLAFDLPGHGLSSGARGGIDDFSRYAAVLQELLVLCSGSLPRPIHGVGHSTGCAVLYEFLLSDAETLDRLVFLAPLVRSAYWVLSRAGTALAEPFFSSVPRVERDNSSDPAYLELVRSDPLRVARIPWDWVEAHRQWYDRLQQAPPVSRGLLIVQGEADDVVDWEYNIEFLRARMSPVTVRLIPDARHQLFHERADLRAVVLQTVRGYLR